MATKVRITYADGTSRDVNVTPKAEVAFEAWANQGIHLALSKEHGKNTNVYRLAWECCKAAGIVVKLFDEWLDEIVDADLVADDPKAVATSPAAD